MGTGGKAVVLLAVIACGLLAAGCGGARSRYANHMQRGQEYFSKGLFPKANLEFRNALQIAPKDAAARVMLGRTAESLGRLGDAIGNYQAVIDSTPDNVDARVHLARIFLYGGDPERALKVIEPALAHQPDNADFLSIRAAARIGLKDEAGALADVTHALKVAPNNEDAVGLRARMYRQAGDLGAATTLVSDAVERVPSSTQLREILTDLYLARGQPEKGFEQLQALIKLEPTDPRRRIQLAIIYLRTHHVDEAQRTLEDAVKAFPADNEAKLGLVDFLAAQRSPAVARAALEAYIARDPDNHALGLGLGALLQRTGATADALKAYADVIRGAGKDPDGLTARDRVAAMDVAAGRYDDARKLVTEVLEKNPRDNDALTLRGEMSLAQSDPAAAIVDLRAVLKDQPQSMGLQRALARAYVANGQDELAEQVLRGAMELDPADRSVRSELAKLLLKHRNFDQALALAEGNVRAAPTDVQAREELVRAYLAKPDFVAARAAAEELKAVRPDSPAGAYMAGLVAQGENRLDDAEREYRRALALQPTGLDVLSALARLKMQRGQPAAAIAVVRKALDGDAGNAFLLNLLAEMYLTQKQLPEATDALTRAIKLSPNWWVPYRSLAAARYMAKDVEGAISTYLEAMKAAPSEPKLAIELADIYRSQGRIDDAIACYDGWVRRNPHVPMIANNLAMLLVTYRSDRASLDRARDLTAGFDSSNEGDLLDTSGWVHFKRAEYRDALPVLRRAAERVPNSPEVHFHLGMAELRLGESDQARSDLESALSSANFAGHDEARSALASLKSRTS